MRLCPSVPPGFGQDRLLGRLEGLLRSLNVDPDVLRKAQLDRFPAGKDVAAEGGAKPRELGAQRSGRIGRPSGRPDCADQLAATDRAPAVDDEVGKKDATLATAQLWRQMVLAAIDSEASTELDPHLPSP